MQKPEAELITAVILAGGRGSRLQGRDKGLVPFQRRPMIEHILEKIIPQVSQLIINANRSLDRYSSYGFSVISDAWSDYQGPLAGVSAAMMQASTPYILTLPCDGPFLTVDYVERMCRCFDDDETEIAVAHDGQRMQAVHLLLPVTLLANLEDYLRSGERAANRWIKQQHYALADFSDHPDIFHNVNTNEQLQSLSHAQDN